MAKAIPGVETNLQADEQAFSEAMSVGLRGAVNSYADTHPDIGLQLLRYTRTVDNETRLVLDAAVDAPDEEAVVQLTRTRNGLVSNIIAAGGCPSRSPADGKAAGESAGCHGSN